jgi:type IV secretory pathway ATPase VirB11/archaellum biosynthesis ATPase
MSIMEPISFPPGRESLIRSIASNNVTIVLGETGSGKTTRMLRYRFLVIWSL